MIKSEICEGSWRDLCDKKKDLKFANHDRRVATDHQNVKNHRQQHSHKIINFSCVGKPREKIKISFVRWRLQWRLSRTPNFLMNLLTARVQFQTASLNKHKIYSHERPWEGNSIFFAFYHRISQTIFVIAVFAFQCQVEARDQKQKRKWSRITFSQTFGECLKEMSRNCVYNFWLWGNTYKMVGGWVQPEITGASWNLMKCCQDFGSLFRLLRSKEKNQILFINSFKFWAEDPPRHFRLNPSFLILRINITMTMNSLWICFEWIVYSPASYEWSKTVSL